jgi:curved DNA-binding protein
LELPITPWEAALRQTVTVPTLGGDVELKIPAGSQSGRTLRLKGRGLPGDQYVRLKIETPQADSAAAKALYEKMAQEMPMNPHSTTRA